MRDRVADDFRDGVHAHLVQDARFVSAYCLNTQVELLADVGDGFALCQQVENLEFSVRQLAVRQWFFRCHDIERKLFSDFHADVGFA